ncbi:uncharacterized protein LOC117224803 [Megalopta genalis]|uniref:uncharacterized protein LOC117224803 n=1 Tax=Megalopta genalis TaxID=115081 RepID=UPI003FD05684
MRIFSISVAVLLAAFPSVFCGETSGDPVDGNSEHLNPNQGNPALYGRVITLAEPATSDAFDKVLRLLRQTFDQESGKISEDLDAWVSKLNNFASRVSGVPEPEGKNEGTEEASETHKLSRRSVTPLETQENNDTRAPESRFSKQASNSNSKLTENPRDESAAVLSPAIPDDNQHPGFDSWIQEVNALAASIDRGSSEPSFPAHLERRLEELLDRIQSRYDNNHLLNLLPIVRLENIGLPGQPIRRILHPIFERLAARTKPTETERQPGLRLARKLFADGRSLLSTFQENRETGGAGIHKAVKLGPLSVNFDVGRS